MRSQKYASAMVIDRTEADGVCVPIALAWKDRRAAAITIVWASPAEKSILDDSHSADMARFANFESR